MSEESLLVEGSGESSDYRKKKTPYRVRRAAARLLLLAALAGSGAKEVRAQRNPENGLEQYGKVTLYNVDGHEGGTRGYGGVVQDPMSGKVLVCTVGHVARGGGVMREAFTEQRSGGNDPVLCGVVRGNTEDFSNAPRISTESVDEGDVVSMVDDERNTVNFAVIGTEPNKVWLVPSDPDAWKPGRGDSGSLVGRVDGEEIAALGVYGGQRVEPNRDNPSEPIVTYYMIPFEEVAPDSSVE